MRAAKRTPGQWLALYSEWEVSGESQIEFCVKREINYYSFRQQTHISKAIKQAKEKFAKKEVPDVAE